MSRPNEINRGYRITDAEMLEAAKTIQGFFVVDKADFILFDAAYADPYATNWLAEIVAAEAMLSDEAVVDQQMQLTVAVEGKMNLCRNKFQNTKPFIEKAFANNQAVWNEFGYDNYEDARSNQSKMVLFMQTFFTIATKYKVQLIAKNYGQPKINEIKSLKDDLNAALLAQDLFQGSRGVLAQDRIIQHNKVWTLVAEVGRAGKLIYDNNYAKYQHYLLPPDEGSGGGPTPVTYNYTTPVPPLPLVGEIVTGSIGGFTAEVSAIDGVSITVINATGVFVSGEMLTGAAGGRVVVS